LIAGGLLALLIHRDVPRAAASRAPLSRAAASECTASLQAPAGVTRLAVSVASPTSGKSYAASIYAPAQTGPLPAVVVMHGAGGSQCDLAWLAGRLATHGYLALTMSDPTGDRPSAIEATRSGVRFLRSASNPLARRTMRDRIGLVGHSRGAAAATAVQQHEPGVLAIVDLDNLQPKVGDGSGAVKAHARVPALSEGSEFYPAGRPFDPEWKKRGYEVWRAGRVAAIEVVLRGFSHGDFTYQGTPAQHRLVFRYALAWFDRWLLGRRAATRQLLARRVGSAPVATVLSAKFRSAAFLPGVIDCENLVACLRR
jgi:hypothetical protein